MRRTGYGVASAVLLLAGWALFTQAGDRIDSKRTYEQVIGDPAPGAAEVIAIAGAPDDVARAGDGSLLLTYDPSTLVDDEGPAAFAWRLYGPDGEVVTGHAEHRDAASYPGDFHSVAGGFVFVPPTGDMSEGWFLDVRGDRHPVRVQREPLVVERGDVLISEFREATVYRPSTRTAAPVAGLPEDVHGLVVDDRGTVWSTRMQEGEVVWWRDGERHSRRLPEGVEAVERGRVSAGGGTAVVPVIRSGGGGETARGFFLTTDGGRSWRTSAASAQLPLDELGADSPASDLDVLADGRLLIRAEGRFWLADDRGNRSFHELERPAGFVSVTSAGGVLYGIADSSPPNHLLVEGEGVWTSGDGGRTWSRLPVGTSA